MNFESVAINLHSVSFAYPSHEAPASVVQNIDLSIRRSEWVAVVGTNGSGKSTLAKLIAKLFNPTAGTITYHVEEQPPIQLIFQNPDTQIIGDTVYEDVCFGMQNYGVQPQDMPVLAAEVLGKVGLASLTDAPVAHLSGGQKQLLSIAACLAVNPAVFLFDEATSMLDPLSRGNIAEAAQNLHNEGKTVIWITQLLDELAFADRVIALDKGSIVFNGTPRQFFYGEVGTGGVNGLDGEVETLWTADKGQMSEARQSCCERLGFVPPYTVQTARFIMEQGFKLDPLPITPAELGKAVSAL